MSNVNATDNIDKCLKVDASMGRPAGAPSFNLLQLNKQRCQSVRFSPFGWFPFRKSVVEPPTELEQHLHDDIKVNAFNAFTNIHNTNIVMDLVNRGLDVNCQNDEGEYLINKAFIVKNITLVDRLLMRVDVISEDLFIWTAKNKTIKCLEYHVHKGNVKLTKKIFEYLEHVCHTNEIVELVLTAIKNNANGSLIMEAMDTIHTFNTLLSNNLYDVNAIHVFKHERYEIKGTLLHMAIMDKRYDVVRILRSKGIKINIDAVFNRVGDSYNLSTHNLPLPEFIERYGNKGIKEAMKC